MDIYKEIKKMSKNHENTDLKNAVIADLLNYEDKDSIVSYMKDVLNYGCVNGTCHNLIYYKDTYAFAKKHIEDIMALLDTIKEETGEEFNNYNGDRLNTLAWLSYEETIRNIVNELEIDY